MVETISDRVRDVGDGLILTFPISQTSVGAQTGLKTVKAYFFRVVSQSHYRQEYTQLGTINSGSTDPATGYDYLGDTGVGSGEDIFRMETDDWHMMHFGLAPNHPDLRVQRSVSPKANGNPAQDRDGTGEDITPGTDARGFYTTGRDISNVYDPEKVAETVSFRNDDDGEFLQWAFWNAGTSNLSGSDTDLIITGRAYKTVPVLDTETQDRMLEAAMTTVDNPSIDTIAHQVGGVNSYQLGTEEPDAWRDEPAMKRVITASNLPNTAKKADQSGL